jgi:hypothetical protein
MALICFFQPLTSEKLGHLPVCSLVTLITSSPAWMALSQPVPFPQMWPIKNQGIKWLETAYFFHSGLSKVSIGVTPHDADHTGGHPRPRVQVQTHVSGRSLYIRSQMSATAKQLSSIHPYPKQGWDEGESPGPHHVQGGRWENIWAAVNLVSLAYVETIEISGAFPLQFI